MEASDTAGARDGALFDPTATRFDLAYERPGSRGAWLRLRLAAVVAAAGPGPGEALDVGAGSGRLAGALAAAGWTVSAVDPSERMLELIRHRLPDAGDRIRAGAVESLPFEDGRFDVVTLIGVLRFVDDLDAAFRELARVTAPGGRLLVTIRRPLSASGLARQPLRFLHRRNVGDSYVWYPWRDGRYWRPPSGMLDGIRAAGFELVERALVAPLVVPEPLDRVHPGGSGRLAEIAAGSSPLRWAFATQVLVTARRSTPAPAAGVPTG